ncbi:ATP-dependent DNA helicase [Podosphaera aphanis]|nr:ATP-dependent DNA helicase [Podosphaera aphanis]
MSQNAILSNLNQSQSAAVTSAHGQLSILAGPGSGKTHTLVSRTAWLLSQGLRPYNVIVTTFTVKAAREMKERIGKLVGQLTASELILGTFHSITRRYLAQYGHLIGIPKDFGIADSSDSLAIIKRIVKRHEFNIDPKVARSRISGLKARGGLGKLKESESNIPSVEADEFKKCYLEYEDALNRSNLLDYDDLLLRCVDLLRKYPKCVANVEAVLIDEFQDTNIVQFDLMRLFAAHRNNITVVGDPDQSIYGFRAAETKNYKRMKNYYPDSVTVTLEENYRSSGAILLTAMSVIEQDSGRVPKTLFPTHAVGTRPVLRRLPNAQREAEWITVEIQRVIGMTAGLLDLQDFSILLRSAALSRLIESALTKAGLAYRMVGGVKFYDRAEVKTILDYLRVISQPENNDALARIINVPSRRIGENTIKKLLEEAERSKITLWSLILRIVQGRSHPKTKVTKQVHQALTSLSNIILTSKTKFTARDNMQDSILHLTKYLLKEIKYEEWLEKHYNDIEKTRWSNVIELMTQITEFQSLVDDGYEDKYLPLIDGVDQIRDQNFLTIFLANVALTSEAQAAQNGEVKTPQITISTIHAAKGLEWPVVFIPASYQGSIPHSRADDLNEERRLLYVAMTRAKILLYMSHPLKNSQGEKTQLTPFLSPSSITPLIHRRGPIIASSVVQSISHMLQRPLSPSAAISSTSLSLPSQYDDLFLSDQENEENSKMQFNSVERTRNFTVSQSDFKRRRINLEESNKFVAAAQLKNLQSISTNASVSESSISPSSLGLKCGFISAATHLSTQREVIKLSTGKMIKKATFSKSEQSKDESASKPANKHPLIKEAQKSLLGYFRKTEPDLAKDLQPGDGIAPREMIQHDEKPFAIEDALAHHRPCATVRFRPKVTPSNKIDQSSYTFLSSPPSSPGSAKPPTLESNPSNPKEKHNHSISHTMTPAILPQRDIALGKKTLGVKRSMKGWSKGKGFVPPKLNQEN